MFVQFSNANEQSIISIFSCFQEDTMQWPNQGEVEVDDPRLLAYIESLPPFIREALFSA